MVKHPFKCGKPWRTWKEYFQGYHWSPPVEDNTTLRDICEAAGAVALTQLFTDGLSVELVGDDILIVFTNDDERNFVYMTSLLGAIADSAQQHHDMSKVRAALVAAIALIDEVVVADNPTLQDMPDTTYNRLERVQRNFRGSDLPSV